MFKLTHAVEFLVQNQINDVQLSAEDIVYISFTIGNRHVRATLALKTVMLTIRYLAQTKGLKLLPIKPIDCQR